MRSTMMQAPSATASGKAAAGCAAMARPLALSSRGAALRQQCHHAEHHQQQQQQQQRVVLYPCSVVCRASSASSASSSSSSSEAQLASVPSTANGKLISKTEVAAFIQRDDMMDQMYRWAIIEAGEGGVRNFGLPMNVEPFYLPTKDAEARPVLWGFKLGIFKEGTQVCDMAVMFDQEDVSKHEWVGRGDDGFPVLEGKVEQIHGKHFEIWKLCSRPVDEQLRTAIRSFCTGLVTALNRYYAFGSVFVDDAQ